MKYKYLTVAVAIAAGVTLAGCTLMPNYDRPAAPVEAAWPSGPAYNSQQAGGTPAAELGWQSFFRDPALQRLIGVALDNNRDLRQAVLNVEAFRAQYRIQRSELVPSLSANGSGSRQRMPADLSGAGAAQMQSQYGVTVDLSAYEVDVFGRIRSLTRQALETYLASEEAQRSVHIALVGDVATTYLTWRTDQALLDLTQSTLRSYQESLGMILASAEIGIASDLDVRQARTLVSQARAQEALYTRSIAQDGNALQLLLGAPMPKDLPAGLAPAREVLAEVPAGLPADLLLQRPDIRAAEHRLRAANANIGAARAAFFPSIRLTANAGTISADLSGLFDGGSGTWGFMPQISVPIFTAGRLKANLDYAQVQKDMNVAQYEKSIQTAFREVADGLAARGTYGKQLEAQRALVEDNGAYYRLARQRYDKGVDNYLTVLDAQRQLFSSEQILWENRLRQLTSEVALYKALGGGWSPAAGSEINTGGAFPSS
jgi:multidrug efflux system outer membrane protein